MPDPAPRSRRFPWRAVFQRTTTPLYVVGPTHRLRYANPAWEKLAGRPLAKVRGMRVSSRRSAAALAQTLAPPPDAWAGQSVSVRRPAPDADAGPPWWDITFVPLPGEDRPFAVLGFVTVVGEGTPRASARMESAVLGGLRHDHAAHLTFDLFAGGTPAAERLVALARLAAQTSAPVWIIGEAGSGKETLARVLHHSGPTREQAFVGLDCAGLAPFLIESLLFGKAGLAASRQLGTLYLKDPAALPRDLQDRVANLFAARPGARLICGAPTAALDAMRDGRLIPPFHAALSVLEIVLPPLRNRLEELPRIADRLLARFGNCAITEEVWPVLRSHDWPGNVRELADVLAQAVRRAGTEPLRREHLPRRIRERHLIASNPLPTPGRSMTLDAILEAVEKRLIERALRDANGSQTDAAEALGIFRTRLWRRMEALGIERKK
jgi:DNA-binding NtrC family response regulator